MIGEKKKKKCILAKDVKGNSVIKIEFPYDLDVLLRVRTLTACKYYKLHENWTAGVTATNIERLQSWGFEVEEDIMSQVEKERQQALKPLAKIPGLKGTLFPFQEQGVAFIENKNGRALVADEMGLGKTVQALAWLQLHRDLKPVIIVVPAPLKIQWEEMIRTWLPAPKVTILSGRTVVNVTSDIYIINYDVLPDWLTYLQKLNPQVLITDECHYYKNNGAQRTRAIKKLGKRIPHIIGLSGTPILSRPIEIYNAWKLIDTENCPDYMKYIRRYCAAKNTGFGWDLSGAAHTDELHFQLSNSFMIRRLKKDVLKELPDKISSFVPIALNNISVYRRAEDSFIEFVKETKGAAAAAKAGNAEKVAQINALKQIAVEGKLPHVIEWIENFIEIEDKLVVFAHHHFVIDTLMEHFSKIAVKIDGRSSSVEREKAKKLFVQDENIKLFIGGIQATKEGINLTVSSNVAFIEFPWTPGDLDQCADRCHRYGQKSTVNIYYLLAQNTIEHKIAHILDNKRTILDAVLDGKVTEQTSLLTELIKYYGNNDKTRD